MERSPAMDMAGKFAAVRVNVQFNMAVGLTDLQRVPSPCQTKNLTSSCLVNNDSDKPDAGAIAQRIARFLLTGSTHLKTQTLTQAQRKALVGAVSN